MNESHATENKMAMIDAALGCGTHDGMFIHRNLTDIEHESYYPQGIKRCELYQAYVPILIHPSISLFILKRS